MFRGGGFKPLPKKKKVIGTETSPSGKTHPITVADVSPPPPTAIAAKLLAKHGGKKTEKENAAMQLLNSPLPGLDDEQNSVLSTILSVGQDRGATPEELLAAVETGIVESNLRNLPGGDADSQGWRQERTSIYGEGPDGPRNVRASAERFFDELKSDPGTADASTPGLLAQAAQGSAYPERYDEHEAEAKSLLQAAGAQAGKQRRLPSSVWFGKKAENKFGLNVGENPAFGGVDPVHTGGSYHYQRDKQDRGEAIDVTGDPQKLQAFDEWVAKKYPGVTELFYDPGVNIDNGQPTSPIGGHDSHVHVSAIPGTPLTASGAAIGAPPSSGSYVGPTGTSSSAPSSGLLNAALGSTQPDQSEPEESKLKSVLGLLESPLPSVRGPLKPLNFSEDEILKLALRRR